VEGADRVGTGREGGIPDTLTPALSRGERGISVRNGVVPALLHYWDFKPVAGIHDLHFEPLGLSAFALNAPFARLTGNRAPICLICESSVSSTRDQLAHLPLRPVRGLSLPLCLLKSHPAPLLHRRLHSFCRE